jgi:hypothetical protein
VKDLDPETIAAAALAHAIRLGKRPKPGQILAGNLSLDSIDDQGRHIPGEKHPIEFEVTLELLAAAEQLINNQQAQYREPKTTALSLSGEPIPEVAWELGRNLPRKT